MTDATSAQKLRQYVEQIEKVDEELDNLKEDRKQFLKAAKGDGFDTKIINKIVKIRKSDSDKQKFKEEQELLETYLDAVEQAPKQNTGS